MKKQLQINLMIKVLMTNRIIIQNLIIPLIVMIKMP